MAAHKYLLEGFHDEAGVLSGVHGPEAYSYGCAVDRIYCNGLWRNVVSAFLPMVLATGKFPCNKDGYRFLGIPGHRAGDQLGVGSASQAGRPGKGRMVMGAG